MFSMFFKTLQQPTFTLKGRDKPPLYSIRRAWNFLKVVAFCTFLNTHFGYDDRNYVMELIIADGHQN